MLVVYEPERALMSGTGWRRTELVDAVRTMAGEAGASTGEMGEMEERDDGRDSGRGVGRRTAGRMMPVSGVDVAEARLEFGWLPVRMEAVARGEATGVEAIG